MTDDTDARKYIGDYIGARHVMMLSTVDGDFKPWICTVYYVFVNEQLLFVSRPASRHARDVASGANVAFAITDTEQSPAISAHGIQGSGFARPALAREYPGFIRNYVRQFPKYGDEMRTLKLLRASLQNATSSRPYVVEIHSVKLTDKRFRQEPVTLPFQLEASL
jgi:uncharacterized protein